jgi:Spy/CpxP family protein refolding chaperone
LDGRSTASGVAEKQGIDATEAEQRGARPYRGALLLIDLSLRDLDLTVERRSTVERIRALLLATMDPGVALEESLANVLADGVAAGVVDRAQADAAIAQLGEAIARRHQMACRALDQLHDALTPRLRAVLIGRLEVHWGDWKDALGHDEGTQEPATNPGSGLAALTTELGLSQGQADRIEAALASETRTAPGSYGRAAVEAHMRALARAFAADTFDAEALGPEPRADTHLVAWGATRMARLFEAVAPVITVEDRTRLAQDIRHRVTLMP